MITSERSSIAAAPVATAAVDASPLPAVVTASVVFPTIVTAVEAVETDLDKDAIKLKLRELYTEAQNLEII